MEAIDRGWWTQSRGLLGLQKALVSAVRQPSWFCPVQAFRQKGRTCGSHPRLAVTPRRAWTWVLLAGIALFTLVTRFAMVHVKPLHHDESLFAYYSYFLYRGWGYEYQPILHGPILEHVTALVFLLFGDNKLTMRLPAIVGGMMLLPVAWYWRRHLGRTGVIAAWALIALSPSITYYSRFLRNDVPYMMVTVWCALCVLRALQTNRAVYYLWGVLSATIMFSMMESSIFFFAACIGFLGVTTLADWTAGAWKRLDNPPAPAASDVPPDTAATDECPPPLPPAPPSVFRLDRGEIVACCTVAAILALAAAWLFHRVFYSTLHVYKPVVAVLRAVGADIAPRTANCLILAGAWIALCALCAVVRINWRMPLGQAGTLHRFLHSCWRQRYVLAGAFMLSTAIYTTLFTTYFTHVYSKDFGGNTVLMTPLQIYKNTWDYWWDQHQLHRIKGPFHYYLPILLMYELPLLAVCVRGFWNSLKRRRDGRNGYGHIAAFAAVQAAAVAYYLLVTWMLGPPDWKWMDKTLHLTSPVHLFLVLLYVQVLVHGCGLIFVRGRKVESFLIFWSVTSLFAYSYAGEKVPWLTVHTTGPLCLLAGLYLGRWWRRRSRTGWRHTAAWTLIAVAVVWQVRNTLLLNFHHPHSPAERLVYNHTSPDIEVALADIEKIAHETNYGRQLPMLVKGEMEWPLFWYLRGWTNTAAPLDETAETTSRPVVLVNWDRSDARNLVENYHIRRLKVREWWEPPMLDLGAMFDIYRALTPLESRTVDAGSGQRMTVNGIKYSAALAEWAKLWRYLAYRDIWLDPDDRLFSNSANEFALCVRKDLQEAYLQQGWLRLLPMRKDIPVYP